MHRKLTITLTEEVYDGLHRHVGRGQISGFIEDLVRPHVVDEHELESLYREMAADVEREREALEWIEGLPDEALGNPIKRWQIRSEPSPRSVWGNS